MVVRFPTILAAALLLVSPNLWAQSQPADPPSRVGRLSAIEGNVQQRTPDDNDWGAANLNYPVSTGFAIAPQDGGRAEIQMGSTAVRVGPQSELDVTNLSDAETSLTLAQGELSVRVGEIPRGERIEIVTPRGVMEILAAGQYHLDAGTTESPTRFEVFNGRAEVQRDGGNSDLASGQAALVNTDQSLSTAQAQPDPLDQWAFARDRGPAPRTSTASVPPPAPPSAPAPYISPEMTGEADLSAYGNWSPNPDYGEVWYPSGVSAGWAPYTYGHWAWVSPWGWTWIDDEPWGFAPFHYGRWAYLDGGWGWIPGEVVVAPVYAPALVVFIGGPEHRFFWDHDHEGVGWFPLGPREAYVPGYRTSIDYVRNVNRTNVDVRNLSITRANGRFAMKNQRGETVNNFVNHRFATVVPASQFGSARRVHDVAVHNALVTTAAASLPVSRDPPVTQPRTAAGATATTRAATLNRTGRPPLPQAHAESDVQPTRPGTASPANASTRTIAGHSLPALPPAHGNATGSNASSRFGASARTPTATTTRPLPPVPSASGDHGPRAAAINNATPTGRPARGPFGTTRSGAPNVTTGSTGRNLPQVPTTRRTVTRPPTPQSHIAQPSAANTSTGHRGLSAPSTPRVQRNTAAPTHALAPPPRAQAPVRSFTPPRAPTPPHFAAPAHSAPRAAPARSIGNATVSHAPHPQPAPPPANNTQRKNPS